MANVMLLYVLIGFMLIFIVDTLVLPAENDQTNKISPIDDENNLGNISICFNKTNYH